MVLDNVAEALSWRRVARAEAIGLATDGHKLSDDSAAELERRLEQAPKDLETRIRLLGFYFLRQFESDGYRRRRSDHVLWLIKNEPGSPLLSTPFAKLETDEDAYAQGRALWAAVASRPDASREVLQNAALFLEHKDPDSAKSLWARANR